MNVLVFILCMWMLPNPYHVHEGNRLRVPPSIALAAYVEASRFEDVTPELMIGMMMHEHRAGAPYPTDSVGDDGRSVGLYQLSHAERVDYNQEYDTLYKRVDLFDPVLNTRVAAYTFHDDMVTHATKRRCRGKKHTPAAHHVCGPKHRDGDRCVKRARVRDNLIRHLSRWKRRALW